MHIRQGGQMTLGKASVLILDTVKMLDQAISCQGPVANQRANLAKRGWFDLPAFRCMARALLALARMPSPAYRV